MHHVIGRAGEKNVAVDASNFIVGTLAIEKVFVCLWFPCSETWARAGAAGAALLSVTAIGGAEFVFNVEWLVATSLVVVPDDIVRAGDDAAGTAGAQAGGNDLAKEFLPLKGPAFGFDWSLGGAHGR